MQNMEKDYQAEADDATRKLEAMRSQYDPAAMCVAFLDSHVVKCALAGHNCNGIGLPLLDLLTNPSTGENRIDCAVNCTARCSDIFTLSPDNTFALLPRPVSSFV